VTQPPHSANVLVDELRAKSQQLDAVCSFVRAHETSLIEVDADYIQPMSEKMPLIHVWFLTPNESNSIRIFAHHDHHPLSLSSSSLSSHTLNSPRRLSECLAHTVIFKQDKQCALRGSLLLKDVRKAFEHSAYKLLPVYRVPWVLLVYFRAHCRPTRTILQTIPGQPSKPPPPKSVLVCVDNRKPQYINNKKPSTTYHASPNTAWTERTNTYALEEIHGLITERCVCSLHDVLERDFLYIQNTNEFCLDNPKHYNKMHKLVFEKMFQVQCTHLNSTLVDTSDINNDRPAFDDLM
jgi:hypothetical protein